MTKVYSVHEDGIYTFIMNVNCSDKKALEILQKPHWVSSFKEAKENALRYLNSRNINPEY